MNFNFRLYDAVIEALAQAATDEVDNLALCRTGDFGDYRFMIGRIAGLRDALAIAEETRKKLMQEG